MVATRELEANSGRVMEELEKEGMLVITKDGAAASAVGTSELSMEEFDAR